MVMPVVSRITSKASPPIFGFRRSWVLIRTGATQKPPFNLDLGCTLVKRIFVADGLANGAEHGNSFDPLADYDHVVAARNTARSRFVDKLGQSSQLGSTLTSELRKTWGTVVDLVTKALFAARAMKRRDPIEALKILGFSPPVVRRTIVRSTKTRSGRRVLRKITRDYWVMPNGRYLAKGAANKWLLYSYGVKPLCQDIYNAMDVLTRDPPSTIVRGSATASAQLSSDNISAAMKASFRVQAHVRVGNPNLWLANQLGLLNPAQWVLEGIPFSFVVDWFSNLTQIVNQMTDFVGLVITKPCTSQVGICTETVSTVNGNNVVYEYIWRRTLTVPEAQLRFAYERFSWQRGLNAISLLVGFLKDVPHGSRRSSF